MYLLCEDMRNWPQSEKAIIIDTEMYAGNFEREMVAYVTGEVGECGVGTDAAEVAQEELPAEARAWFEMNIVQTSDEHGCWRPASIAPTPGWSNNGHGKETKLKPGKKMKYPAYMSVEFCVNEWPPDNIMEVILGRVKKFCADWYPNRSRMAGLGGLKPIPFTGIRWAERNVTETQIKEFGA